MNDGKLSTKILPVVINEILASKFTIVPVKDLTEASIDLSDLYELKVLPSEYFSPKYYWTGEVVVTPNTVCIHHFFGSWLPPYLKTEAMICQYLGIKNLKIIERVSWK